MATFQMTVTIEIDTPALGDVNPDGDDEEFVKNMVKLQTEHRELRHSRMTISNFEEI